MEIEFNIDHPGNPSAGISGYTETVRVVVENDPGDEREFGEYMIDCLADWFDGAKVKLNRTPPKRWKWLIGRETHMGKVIGITDSVVMLYNGACVPVEELLRDDYEQRDKADAAMCQAMNEPDGRLSPIGEKHQFTRRSDMHSKQMKEACDALQADAKIYEENIKRAIRHTEVIDALLAESGLEVKRAFIFAGNVSKYAQITLCANVNGFTIEAAPELASFLEKLLDVSQDAAVTTEDSATEPTRQYAIITRLEDDTSMHVVIRATLSGDGVCRRVQVGTKKTTRFDLVEADEPIYEFIC